MDVYLLLQFRFKNIIYKSLNYILSILQKLNLIYFYSSYQKRNCVNFKENTFI